jgi:hypothetical protein
MERNCPLSVEEEGCSQCHFAFGPDKCGVRSIAEDMSMLVEIVPLIQELTVLLKNKEI